MIDSDPAKILDEASVPPQDCRGRAALTGSRRARPTGP
jgi:hypothetical protein